MPKLLSENLEQLPVHSYDLIDWLYRNVALPRFKVPGEDLEAHLESGGARKLIDVLYGMMQDELTGGDEADASDVSPGVTQLDLWDGNLPDPDLARTGRVLGPQAPSFSVEFPTT